MKRTKLKPCPFCGSKAEMMRVSELNCYGACRSTKCRALGPNHDPDGNKWNRRPRAKRKEVSK